MHDDAVTPEEYLAGVDERRRADAVALDALICATAPGLPRRVMSAGMIGYGPFRYRYATGREGDAAPLAANSRRLSLHVLSAVDGRYLAGRYADRLPKASVGRSCIRFTRLSDLDPDVVRELIADATRRGPQDAAGSGGSAG